MRCAAQPGLHGMETGPNEGGRVGPRVAPAGFPLDFMDPNQPDQVTGYDVYRSSSPALPPDDWPLVASDVIDMDEATPNKQWIDTTGDVSPTGAWFYQAAAYNHRCPAEGPR